MLKEIRIRNMGVIADATLELSPGLNVVTGETGAGKTMVVSGLGLLLGERADADRVRTGEKRAVVEGFLDLPDDHAALATLRDEFEFDGDEELILSRTVAAGGRSRAHVAGRSVPASVLAQVGHDLVAVHGQADQWRLKRPEEHREVLDSFAGAELAALAEQYREGFVRLKALRAERRELTHKAQERAQRLTMLEAGIARIDELEPVEGEDVELAAESERLTHAEDLLAAGTGAAGALAGDETDPDQPNALALLAHARSVLDSAVSLDASLGEYITRLKEIQTLTADLAADVSGYASGIDMDPARLADVHQRRAALTALMKAFGPELSDVVAWRTAAGVEAEALAGSDDRVSAIDAEIASLTPKVADLALRLHDARVEAATKLAQDVTAELAHLAMSSARLEVAVTLNEAEAGLELGDGRIVKPTEHGIDDVALLLAANKGIAPKPVTKAASGGELSRVMLALEVVSSTGEVPTFVFDEVDAGVGGEAAVDIGARLAKLSEQAQVIVVTHLAQVAAFADNHLVVHKSHDGAVTESGVTSVTGEARHEELARMLGGDASSAVAVEHAKQLLASSDAIRREAMSPAPVR
ncbi:MULTISPECIES: DNA repair protein RecN [Dermacoccus]|uniref:DNA repair protein RecN n=2 Tax=Dermacoccus TaxID=57495 RepID=A0A417ZAK0_9MICO|nr:DNA repair protein RecN [Dermacoccus abyssi]RHW47664.1 DNA repair protein RecN [Dermacoccus abyssi]